MNPKTILRWAGGKTALAEQIKHHFPPRYLDYWEPFCGSAALYFHAVTPRHKAHLSDAIPDLIHMYQQVRDRPEQVHNLLTRWIDKNTANPSFYYQIRETHHDEPFYQAVKMLFISWAGYNGLYRVNAAGKVNTPRGTLAKQSKRTHPTLKELKAVAQRLATNTELEHQDFRNIQPGKGDLIYCDPPYDGSYTHYTPLRFGEQDQRDLANLAREWAEAGAYPIISNAPTQLVREIYPTSYWTKLRTDTRNSIAAKTSARRKPRKEFIIHPNIPLKPSAIPWQHTT